MTTGDTLYITDLDGTLLNSGMRISDRSALLLNRLIQRGVPVSVASARSTMGIAMINLDAVRFRVPLVLMNGVMLYDPEHRRVTDSCQLDSVASEQVLRLCEEAGKNPFAYRVENDRLSVEYRLPMSVGEAKFFGARREKFPDQFEQVTHYSTNGQIYFSMQDRYEVLAPLRDRLSALPGIACTMYLDNYMADNWYLEIFSDRAGKANGVRRLREQLGVSRVVAFGDNLNDLAMLEVADIGCVVKNGVPELLSMADEIIGANDEDGVAEYISRDVFHRQAICVFD